jgi:hypothetical protein
VKFTSTAPLRSFMRGDVRFADRRQEKLQRQIPKILWWITVIVCDLILVGEDLEM